MIVKVQLALSSSESEPPALVYNQGRSLCEFISVADMPESVVAIVKAAPMRKAFFKAALQGTILEFDREVSDPGW